MRDIFNFVLRRSAFIAVKIKTLWLRLAARILYKNKEQRKFYYKAERAEIERQYLRRYLYVLKDMPNEQPSQTAPKIIWTCWWQGKENMPPVVKRCIESMRQHCPQYDIRIVTTENMHNYIELPDYIWQKHQKGYISRTHLSDILRVSLLAKHGGLWLDATVFLTAPIPEKMLEAPFFAYHCREIYQFQIWLLKTAADNPLIQNLRNLLLEYWKYENKTINYFFGYLLFDLIVQHSEKCAKLWAQTPFIYDDCYELESNFFKPYNPQKWAEIKAQTPIHKLSWKYKKEPTENSFLDHLLNNNLKD